MDKAFTATTLNELAADPTYAGALSFARRKFTKDVTGADAVVWGIPLDTATSNRPGTRFGPRGIRAASVTTDNDPQYPFGDFIFDKMSVCDYGDCAFYYGMQSKVPKAIEEEASKILNASSDPYLLSLGGDHFVTLPLLRAHHKKHGPLALVQFDAHQDTWED
ncbi:MAG: arginase family protein, partial [Pseudomonadota bacterium]